ncbi:hypothetical protein CBS101457_004621 [Exobasidium rhododendri]|nr:hypothetical protein CBS101457_004621 [Exobasidium rhododendri]
MVRADRKQEYVSVPQEDHVEHNEKSRDDDLEGRAPNNSHFARARQLGLRLIITTAAVSFFTFLACCSVSQSTRQAGLQWLGLETNALSSSSSSNAQADSLVFGVGVGDASGPIVQAGMMGYASLPQVTTGLHIRQRSRAFIFGTNSLDPRFSSSSSSAADADPNDGQIDRWVFINSDICMGDTALRRAIVDQLRERFPGIYGERNIAFSGTHSHAGPGGYINALIPTVTTYGIIKETFNAIVDGTVVAVQRAHEDFLARREATNAGTVSGKISFDSAILKEAHINRSPYSYSLNPAEERARYDSDQDDEFAMLRFDEGEEKKALLSFYPVHGTSLYENNTLSSGDNKGLAAVMVETLMDPDSMPGRTKFIAGFSQSNVGDTTPNTKGAFCDSGEPCNYKHSTCKIGILEGKERVETCHGRGPSWGDDALLAGPTGSWDWSSNQVIAKYQADTAKKLLDKSVEAMTKIEGEVRSVKWNVAMGHFSFTRQDGTSVTTCPAALGYGFAGGTTDGPGAFDFKQGANDSDSHNPVWDVARTALTQPTKEQIECQEPKRVLLSIGEQQRPYPWGPGGPEGIVETQILRAGNLFILVMPGEFTTMAGRRMKEAIKAKIIELKLLSKESEPVVVLSGPANTYGHYVTTKEEYGAQRYEGGSTLFGPNTLEAYMHIYVKVLLPALVDDDAAKMIPPGSLAPLSIEKAFKYDRPVVYDNSPFRKSFGDVLEQPQGFYKVNDRANVTVTFVAANPRNDLRLESTYLEVQRRDDRNVEDWRTVRTDGHHSTTMRWTQTSTTTGTSKMEIGWLVEEGTPPGMYRIVYYGSSKTPFTGKINPFEGRSNAFTLV